MVESAAVLSDSVRVAGGEPTEGVPWREIGGRGVHKEILILSCR